MKDKIELTSAQRSLISVNLYRHLNSDFLMTRHHKTFSRLERVGIFFIDDCFNVIFTDEARIRLLKIGVDITGNAAIRALRLDPAFINYQKCQKNWDDHCQETYSNMSTEDREKLTNKIYDKYENSIDNARCLFGVLHCYVSKFMETIRIPSTI